MKSFEQKIFPYLLLAPTMIIFGLFLFFPALNGLWISLTKWDGVNPQVFVGVKNYVTLFGDKSFWNSFVRTLIFTLVSVPSVYVSSLGLAVLLTGGVRGSNFFRAAFFTPNLIGGIVLGYIWQFVFKQAILVIGDATGFSLFSTSWLSDPIKAFWALIIVTVWQLSGYLMLIYIAGLMGVSDDLKEAAKIDGCDEKKTTRYIALPMMAGTFTICFFLAITRAFVTYDVNISLTEGGPYGSTTLAAMYVYNMAFSSKKYGLGQAEALILFLVIAIIAVTQAFIGKSKEVEA